MTTIMQIYLTILLGLIVSTIISGVFYIIAKDIWIDRYLATIFGIINIISIILTSSWIVYLILALIWHWY